MAEVKVKGFDELESYQGPSAHGGQFLYAGKSLGVGSWGMNVLKLPPNWAHYPEHDHVADGQEEVYLVLEGSATLKAEGESWALERGMLAWVGAAQKRTIVPGDEGVTMLALGGTPGKPYELPAWMTKKA